MKKIVQILLATLVAYILSGCAVEKTYFSSQQQAKLVRVEWAGKNHAILTMITPANDSVKVLFGSTGMGRPRFVPGTKYTIWIDSNEYKIIDGRKYYRVDLKRNQ